MFNKNEELTYNTEQSYFDLPGERELADFLYKVQSGKIEVEALASGVYLNVLRAEENSDLVLKVLGDDSRVEKAIDRAIKRYGNLSSWINMDFVVLGSLRTINPKLLEQLKQLVFQHEMHSKFLAEHVIPKKFAIVNFTTPVIGEEVSSDYFEKLEVSRGNSKTENSEIIQLPSGKQGRVIAVKLQFGEKRFFEEWENGEPNGKRYGIVVEEGEHVVEVQKRIPFGDSKDVEVIPHGVFGYMEFGPKDEVWDEQFVQELLSFISRLINMLVVGVSIDSSYSKISDANFLVIIENGKKRIVTYDTNNWEVGQKYRDAVTKTFSGNDVTDPYPGIDHEFVDDTLATYLIIPILDRIDKALDHQWIKNGEIVKQVLASILVRLYKLTNESDLHQKVEKRNRATTERMEQVLDLLNEAYAKSDEEKFTSFTDELQREWLDLDGKIEQVKSVPKVIKKLEEVITRQ